jgi:phenylalanyl-tRNA synthetase beta chain
VLGLAREVSAVTGASLIPPEWRAVRTTIPDRLGVTLEAPRACPRYCGRLVKGVNASAATPEWMTRRLQRSGIRAISALVDITNYVMLELGQPLHAFDAARLDGGIRVRYARAGEKLTLINGTTPPLTPDFLVIADEAQAVALAGIMGGLDTAVSDATRDVFLESAFFSPDAIAGRTQSLNFGSERASRCACGWRASSGSSASGSTASRWAISCGACAWSSPPRRASSGSRRPPTASTSRSRRT